MTTRFLGTNVPFLGAHPVKVINESCTEREIRLKYVSLMLYSIAISHEQTTKLSLRQSGRSRPVTLKSSEFPGPG